MKEYLDLVETVLTKGKKKHNRTGIDTFSVTGEKFEYNWNNTNKIPLLTTKKMAYKSMMTELEFFIKGITDKRWLQDRKCHIWDEWCSPIHLEGLNLNNGEKLKKMKEERDLGPIYGKQWREFDSITDLEAIKILGEEFTKGEDQLVNIINHIKYDPESRRMVCSAWNPNQIDEMALPPCHVLWQVLINTEDNTLDLLWYQRSCDLMLGIPFNIASYATLQHLLCLESGKYHPGKLVGFFADLHIYENHVDGAKLQLTRSPHELPKIETENFKSIFEWEATQTKIVDYVCDDKIKFEVAV